MGILRAKYLATQIAQEKLRYSEVISKYPEEKKDIDKILTESNMLHLIEKWLYSGRIDFCHLSFFT